MSLPSRTALSLAAVCLALVVAPAFAAEKPAPAATTLGNAPAPNATINSADCQTGQYQGPATFSVQFVFPPNDEYHTLLDPAACCPGGATSLTVAHAMLNWPVACALPVNVSILGSTGGPCPQPDPNNVICPPTLYILDGSALGVIQHDFPLPGGCCIQGPAFLKIEFVNRGNCTETPTGLTAPRLVADNTPEICTSYNFYAGDPVYRDLVTFWGFTGNPMIWADGNCCGATPTIPSTWGSMKSLYR